jgi:hypothetical protein
MPNDSAAMPAAMIRAFAATAAASTDNGQRRSSMTGLHTTQGASAALTSHWRRPLRGGLAAE